VKKKIWLIILVLEMIIIGGAQAELTELSYNPLNVELAARPLGLGGGFTGLADDLNATLFNPAGLAWSKGISLSLKDSANISALQAYPIGNNSAFGLMVTTVKETNIPITGGVANSDSTIVYLSYGTKLNAFPRQADNKILQMIGLGVNFKGLVGETLRKTGQLDRSATGWDLDLGLLYKGEEWWSAGLLLQNFLPKGTLNGGTIKWDIGGTEGIPSALKIGGAIKIIGDIGSPIFMEGQQFRLAGDLGWAQNKPALIRAGGEYILNNLYYFRSGWQQQYTISSVVSDLNLGLGYRDDIWGLDFSTYRDPLNNSRQAIFSLLYFPKDWIILRELDFDKPRLMLEEAIESISLQDNIVTYDDKLAITGKVKPGVEIYINGLPVTVNTDSTFSTVVPLRLGKNLIIVEARYQGEKKNWKYKVLRQVKVVIADPNKIKDLEKKKEKIESLVTLGVIEIKPDTNFVMETGITRGELATWLVKAADLKVEKVTADLFSDVKKDDPLAPYIKVAVDQKFLQPFADGTFRPNAVVSKAEGEAIFNKFGNKSIK
jgi:hypothetical protein